MEQSSVDSGKSEGEECAGVKSGHNNREEVEPVGGSSAVSNEDRVMPAADSAEAESGVDADAAAATPPNEKRASATSLSPLSQTLSKLRVHKFSKWDNDKKKKSKSGENDNQKPASAPLPLTNEPPMNPEDATLPQTFLVKFLGKRSAKGLWGIKHTRKPVDEMVVEARSNEAEPSSSPLPFLQLTVSEFGVKIAATRQNLNPNFDSGPFPIDAISYGVQDVVYTRVFAMIVVRDEARRSGSGSGDSAPRRGATAQQQQQQLQQQQHPFECYAFVCDSRQNARKLTYALAKAFQEFSKTVQNPQATKPKQFAIDLRTPEQIEGDFENELDSEA